jgi:hypothetical protein
MTRGRLAVGLLLLLRASTARALQSSGDDAESARSTFIASHRDSVVREVSIEGLRRTDPRVVRQWLPVLENEPVSAFDARAAWESLSRLGIFSSIDISFASLPDGGVGIHVKLAEKWTLYPVPMLIYYPGTQIAGLILAESNAAGLNKGWALGGVYSNRGWYTLAAYVDPNIAFTNLYGRVSGFVGSGLLENDTPGGHILQSFDLDRYDVQYSLGYTIGGRFSPTWTGAYRAARVGDIHVPGDDMPMGGAVVSQGVKLIYNDRRARLYYEKGLRSTIEYQHAFAVGDTDLSFDNLVSETSFTHETFRDQTLQWGLYWAFAELPPVFEYRLGGLEGTRTLPAALVAADKYVSATAIYQVPFWSGGWGTATLVGLIEGGAYRRDEHRAVGYWGPGGGISLYLAKVATPTLGFDVAYEMVSGTVNFSVVVGFRPTR